MSYNPTVRNGVNAAESGSNEYGNDVGGGFDDNSKIDGEGASEMLEDSQVALNG